MDAKRYKIQNVKSGRITEVSEGWMTVAKKHNIIKDYDVMCVVIKSSTPPVPFEIPKGIPTIDFASPSLENQLENQPEEPVAEKPKRGRKSKQK
tara:strand:+ start:882 stop:1163 length:282 start_codon:yes stop_codon:yes gene_type:complete